MKKLIVYICILSGFSVLVITAVHGATVVERRGRVHIEDLQNELWDVSQAKTLGFVPEKFQYGFGRDAFVPLDNSHLKSKHSLTVSNPKVIGIANENEAHAYSIERMKMHEIANTVFDGSPIAAAYWPMKHLAAVYSREIDGKTLTLVPSGWTYRKTFVLYDRETGTLWYPDGDGLIGIQGKYFKRKLKKLPSSYIMWEHWEEAHPDTRLVD